MAQAGSSFSKTTTALEGISTLDVYRVPMALAGTEYSQALKANTKYFSIELEQADAKLQLAFTSGQSGTNFVPVWPSTSKDFAGLRLSATTLYFQSDKAAQTAVIVEGS